MIGFPAALVGAAVVTLLFFWLTVRRLRRMQEVPGVAEVLMLSEAQRLQGIETPVQQMAARQPATRLAGGDD